MSRGGAVALLVLLGAGWGLTQPLAKVAVSSGHQPFGLIFWQLALGTMLLGTYQAVRRRPLPLRGPALRWYLAIALIGTVVPNSTSYLAVVHLPAGIMSIVIATVPMFAFPIALALGGDRFSWPRLGGLAAGLAGVVLLIGPKAGLAPGSAPFLLIAMIAPALYGFEGNAVAHWGAGGLGPVTLLLGASLVGAVIAAPLALLTGQWIDPFAGFGAPEAALALSSAIHAAVYTSYVWLVGRAGATFAAQVAYLVTGFGVIWSMALLGERFAGPVWAAMGLMFVGLFLVQPRPRAPLPDAP